MENYIGYELSAVMKKKMSEAYYIGKLAISLARSSHTNKQDLEFTCKHELVKSVDNFRNHTLYLKINQISEKSFDELKEYGFNC